MPALRDQRRSSKGKKVKSQTAPKSIVYQNAGYLKTENASAIWQWSS